MSALTQSIVGLTSRLYTLTLAVVGSVILARALGSEGMGQYFLTLTIATLLATIADLGLSQAAIVYAGDDRTSFGRLHRILLAAAILSALAVAAIAAAAFYLFPSQLARGLAWPLLLAAFATTPLILYNNYWGGMMVGRNEIRLLNVVQAAGSTTLVALVAGLYAADRLTVFAAVWANALNAACVMLAQILLAERRSRGAGAPDDLPRQLLRFGLAGYGGALATMLYVRIGIFILNHFHGNAASGVYAIAFQIADKFHLVVRSLQDAIYRNVIALDREELREVLNRYVRLSFAGLLGLALALIAVAPWVVTLLYGRDYGGAVAPLQLLALGQVAMGVAAILSTFFIGQARRPGLLSWLAALQAVVAIALGLLVIPRWGVLGAAIALFATQISVLVVLLAMYREFAGVRIRSLFVPRAADVDLLREKLQEKREE